MVARRLFLPRVLLVVVAVIITSCDWIGVSEQPETEAEMLDVQWRFLTAMENREQVKDVQINNHRSIIKCNGDNVYSLSATKTAAFHIGNNGHWLLNGLDTGVKVHYNSEGSYILPDFHIGDNQHWWLSNSDSGISAYSGVADIEVNTSFISHLVFGVDHLSVVTTNQEVYSLPVIRDDFYLVPSYYMPIVLQQEKAAEDIIKYSKGDYYAFTFFSDFHWDRNQRHSPAIIHHIVDYTPFEDVVFGGDVITSCFPDVDSAMKMGYRFQSAFSFLGPKFYCLYGNHDNNSTGQQNKTQYHLTDEQVYGWLQNQMTDVCYGGYFNFYYDVPSAKTRVIGLDTGRFYIAQFRDKLPETVAFIIKSLNTVPPGWHAIMASHLWCDATQQSDGTYLQFIPGYIKPILKVLDDYNNRQSGSYTYNGASVPYDFSSADGNISFCIGGHTHLGFITSTDGGIPIVISKSDSIKQPEIGTTKEQSVTLVIADYNNDKLHLLVIGRGDNATIDLF